MDLGPVGLFFVVYLRQREPEKRRVHGKTRGIVGKPEVCENALQPQLSPMWHFFLKCGPGSSSTSEGLGRMEVQTSEGHAASVM